MATKKVNVSNPKALAAIGDYVLAIDQHLESLKVKGAGASRAASANFGTSLCTNFAKAKPVIDLLGMILGKTVGAVIVSISNGISAYCAIDSSLPTTADLKAKSKAIAQICKAYGKFKAVLDLAVMLFATKPEWTKAIKGLQAAIESICANPEA